MYHISYKALSRSLNLFKYGMGHIAFLFTGTIKSMNWTVEDTKTLQVYSKDIIKDENYVRRWLNKFGKITTVELYPENFLKKTSVQSPKLFRFGKLMTLSAKVQCST